MVMKTQIRAVGMRICGDLLPVQFQLRGHMLCISGRGFCRYEPGLTRAKTPSSLTILQISSFTPTCIGETSQFLLVSYKLDLLRHLFLRVSFFQLRRSMKELLLGVLNAGIAGWVAGLAYVWCVYVQQGYGTKDRMTYTPSNVNASSPLKTGLDSLFSCVFCGAEG